MMGLEAMAGAQGIGPSASSNLECEFYMYLFKVQACPKRGAHDWSSCPYAHPKEKARRRDPRVYKYASTPCPESLQGINCGRGVDCPYAHSVYEYWLHPARFRTQMCKKGSQCNRSLCFFAHSASELRFPDTEDELEAAAVDAAAASATAAPLPICHPQQQQQQAPGLIIMQSAAGGSNSSLPLMNIGSMCSDASTATAAMAATLDGSTGSYSMAALQAAAAGSMRQGSGGSQLTAIVDDMSGSFGLGGSSDPGSLLQGLAGQHQQQPGGPNCLSEPLPHLGSDPNGSSLHHTAWLQLATASQLPASQILSSIRSPGAATVSAAQQAQQRQMMQAASYASGLQAAAAAAAAAQSTAPGSSGMMLSGGGGGSSTSTRPLVAPPSMDSSAERLVASLGGLQLQSNNSLSAVDDGSSGGRVSMAEHYAALSAAAAAASRPRDASAVLHHQASLNTAAAAAAAQGVGSSSRAEDFLLLQLLQDKQVQQQQQQQIARLSSTGSAAMGTSAQQTMRPAFGRQASVPAAPHWGFGV